MMRSTLFTCALALTFAACGGGESASESDEAASAPAAAAPAPQPAAPVRPTGEMTMPDWFHVDNDARTVHMTITAGSTDKANYWNYNGATKGEMAITVPVGYTVTIDLVNNDPAMAHSLGIAPTTQISAMMDPTPAFPGAVTANPTSMVDGTMPGESETITFVAETAGNYTMVCYIPAHAQTGMWLFFDVSADGLAGVQGAAGM